MPGAWDKIKTVAKETGEKVIGRGPEVKFRHEAQEYAKKNSVSVEIAQKAVLEKYFGDLSTRVSITRSVEYDSKEWRAIVAAVNETLGPRGIEDLIKTANDPRYPGTKWPMTPASSRQAYAGQENYFKKKFEGRAPDYAVLKDNAENMNTFVKYGVNLEGLLSTYGGHAASLDKVLAANPKIKAEFGRLFQLKALMEKHEDRFKKDMNFEKTWNASKVELQKSVKEMLTGTGNYCVNVVKACQMMFQGNFGAGLMKGLGETAKFLGIETWGVIKVAYHGGKVLGSKVKNF